MDVGSPVRAVIPTLDGSVLQALSGTTAPLSLSDVGELADAGSLSGLRLALLRMVDQGVVLAVPGGYILNREHLAAPAVLLLTGMRSEFMRRIGELSDSWSTAPLLLGVFGSFARRDGDATSDIDLLLVTTAEDADEQAGELAERVHAWTGNQCHVMTLTPADIRRMRRNKERILAEWDRDLETVRGGLAELKGRS